MALVPRRMARAMARGLARMYGAAITTSRELFDHLYFQQMNNTTDGGILITPELAMRLSAVYSCVRVVSEDLAKLPLRVYRRTATGRQEDPNYWLNDLLMKPNTWQTGFEFREMMQAHIELSGNAFAIKTVVRTEVRELIPIPPARVLVYVNDDFTLGYKVTFLDGHQTDVPPDRMLHLKGLTLNGFMGLSPVAYQREAIGLGTQMVKHAARLFKNGASIGGVLQHPQVMDDKAYDRLKSSFEEKYAGVDNAHKMILLEEGTTFTATGLSNKDAEFLDGRKFNRTEIAGIYRVPPHMIADLSQATFSNIEQQSRDYVQNGLMPRAVRLEHRICRDLIPRLDRKEYSVEHDMDELLRADYLQRQQGNQVAVNGGWKSRQEVRRDEGMNPGPADLDEFLVPVNVQTVDQAKQAMEIKKKQADKPQPAPNNPNNPVPDAPNPPEPPGQQ